MASRQKLTHELPQLDACPGAPCLLVAQARCSAQDAAGSGHVCAQKQACLSHGKHILGSSSVNKDSRKEAVSGCKQKAPGRLLSAEAEGPIGILRFRNRVLVLAF